MKLTSQQQKILDAPVGDILVSAAAGSGKTAVLTDRIVQRISRGETDVQHLLVMTFTESAAHEMKTRIETKLRDALSESRDMRRRQYLSRQLSLLPGAAVSTIHAFCLRVIRDFIYLLRDASDQPLLDASFSVDDGIEAELILGESARAILRDCYERIDEWQDGSQSSEISSEQDEPAWIRPFYRLTDSYGSSRTDQPLLDLLIAQYQYLRSLPDYTSFIHERLSDLADAVLDFSSSRHATRIYDMLDLRLRRALAAIPRLRELLSGQVRFIRDPERNQAYHDQFSGLFSCLEVLAEHIRAGQPAWDEIRRIAQPLASLDLPRSNRADTPEKIAFMTLFIEQVAEVVHMLTGECRTKKYTDSFVFDTRPLFMSSRASIEQDLRDMLPVVRQFYQLVLDLDQRYAADKAAAGLIDFSDFEHFALRLLRLPEVSRHYRQRFTEVYIDEYQDTSSIQEAVLQAVSRNNCLMVGDLKQSIYRFRHARPQIFREKALDYEGRQSGTLIELNRNFRSVNRILQSVNDIFHQIMTTGTGEIDYDSRQALVPHRDDHPDDPHPVRFILLTSDETADLNEDNPDDPPDDGEGGGSGPSRRALDTLLSGYEREARLVASRIREQLAAGYALSDIAVLCRTRRMVESTVIHLREAGITVLEGYEANAFDIPELRLAEAFLHLLDNRCQDFPLASVMRSGLAGISFADDDLAEIRLFGRSMEQPPAFFWQAVDHYAESGTDIGLRGKVRSFLDWIGQWRDRSVDLRIDELLEDFYGRSYWLDQLSLRTDGTGRIRVLRQLQTLARQFERQQRRGVHQFVSHLDALREKDALGKGFDYQSLEQDGVRVMTIHGSKGLEFPVVFLIGTSYRLTPRESQEPLLMSESLGIGMDYIDPERQIRYASHLKLAMLEEIRAAVMAEELRLFYVALTRARDRLFVSASVTVRQKDRLLALLRQARRADSDRLPDYLVLSCQSVLHWMVLALARDPEFAVDGLLAADAAGPAVPDEGFQPRPTAWQSEWVSWSALRDEAMGCPGIPPADESAASATVDQSEQKYPLFSQVVPSTAPGGADHSLLRQRVLGVYSHESATRLPVKWAVSELKRREQEWEARDDSGGHDYRLNGERIDQDHLPDIHDQRGINLTLQISDLAGESRLTPRGARQLGTLLHTVLRYLDLPHLRQNQASNAVADELLRMKDQSMLSAEDLTSLKPWHAAIRHFADSDLAGDMVSVMRCRPDEIYREIPFTLAVPVLEIFPRAEHGLHDEPVMIQGMIDCWFIKDGELTLVDYKSDDIRGDDDDCAEILRHRYAGQLNWYARAIEAAQKRPVTRRLIWHIRRGRAFMI